MEFLQFTPPKTLPGGQPYKQGLFRCHACGKTCIRGYYNALKQKSCGCIPSASVHRMKKHPLYARWESMRKRCNNPNEPVYPRYGGRGITVCPEWDSFSTFYNWAVQAGWKPELLLDRIDNAKGYSPDNCRFVNDAESSQNRRSTKLSPHIVAEIKRSIAAGESSRSIRQKFGLSSPALYRIKNNRTWKNI